MPTIVPNKFTEFEFSTAELYAATRLTDLSLQLIQTLAARAAVERLNLRVDANDPNKFIQAEACLTGQIEAYENLIALVESTPKPEENPQQQQTTF